jgi:hypothetical protein
MIPYVTSLAGAVLDAVGINKRDALCQIRASGPSSRQLFVAFPVPLLDYLRGQFIATVLRASKTIAAAAVAFTPFTLLAAKSGAMSNRAPSSDSNATWFFILFCLPAFILFAFFLAYRHRLLLTYKWALFIGYFVSIGATYAISATYDLEETGAFLCLGIQTLL